MNLIFLKEDDIKKCQLQTKVYHLSKEQSLLMTKLSVLKYALEAKITLDNDSSLLLENSWDRHAHCGEMSLKPARDVPFPAPGHRSLGPPAGKAGWQASGDSEMLLLIKQQLLVL